MSKGKKRHILIVDNDPKNLSLLVSNFEEADYVVESANSDRDAILKCEQQAYDVLLTELTAPNVDGNAILKELQRNGHHTDTVTVFLTPKSDVWNRVKSLKLGAKDYIVKPAHVKEIVARVNMISNRIHKNQQKRLFTTKEFSGRLEDLATIDLIEIMGHERKSGTLNLFNENGYNGHITFRNGHIISAKSTGLRAEEAVYRMLTWRRGRFTMLFEDVDLDDEISLSNLGLLLQGAKRIELRNDLLRELPSLEAVVITTQSFKRTCAQKSMNDELRMFMELFDGERTLGRIIDDCRENEIITLKRIVKLYKLGFLHVLRDFKSSQKKPDLDAAAPKNGKKNGHAETDASGLSIASPEAQEFNAFFEDDSITVEFPFSEARSESEYPEPKETPNDAAEPAAKNIVMVLGDDNPYRQQFVTSLSNNESGVMEFDKANLEEVYHGQVELRGGQFLQIISCSTADEFSPLIDLLAEKAGGYILLIDAETEKWKYYSYLVKDMRQRTRLPGLIVAVDPSKRLDVVEARARLGLAEEDVLQVLQNFNRNNCRRLLFSLLNNQMGADTLEPETSKHLVSFNS